MCFPHSRSAVVNGGNMWKRRTCVRRHTKSTISQTIEHFEGTARVLFESIFVDIYRYIIVLDVSLPDR